MKKVILLFILFCAVQTISAQNITAQGIVVDSMGPLSGVTIVQDGTSNGTISDYDGSFSISVPSGCTLTFSYPGYKDKKVKARPNMGYIQLEIDNGLKKSANKEMAKDRRRKSK